MRGRKPKPVEAKRLAGNPGRRPLPEPVILGGRTAPKMPSYLPERAKTAWKQIVPRLADVGMLDAVDGPALEALTINIGLMRSAAAELKNAPTTVPGSHGNVKRHPAFDVFNTAQAEVRTWCERFGLDPATRTRLGMAELQRRSLVTELDHKLGKPTLRKVED